MVATKEKNWRAAEDHDYHDEMVGEEKESDIGDIDKGSIFCYRASTSFSDR
jgi:hypothetical protein